jgi:hypothetical protein
VVFGGVEEKEGGGDALRKDAFSLKWLRLSDGRCSNYLKNAKNRRKSAKNARKTVSPIRI